MAESQLIITLGGAQVNSDSKIRQALERINGVERVIVSLENKKVFIEFDDERISEQLIKETIEDEGYKVK